MKVADWNLKKGLILRAYSPLGFYPPGSFHHRDAIFVVQEDLIFSVVRFEVIELENYYAEREWVVPAEIRLLASLILSVPYICGLVCPYPDPGNYKLEDKERLDLGEKSVWPQFGSLLKEQISKREKERVFHSDPTPLPPFAGGQSYKFNEKACDERHQIEIFNGIDLRDHLLIRGLGALVKGQLLARHDIFHENACMSLYVAMEASLHVILRRLRKTMNNPSNEDASVYLAKAFGRVTYPSKYFEEYYEDRIKTVHPASRFGTFPQPPLAADDFYDLYSDLVAVYDFLITGRIEEEFKGR
ncbi:MAG: hypothetical protein ACFFCW_21585 [Candidatus Hodarchaeota archaeon]